MYFLSKDIMLLLKWMKSIHFGSREKPRAYRRAGYRNLVRYSDGKNAPADLISNLVDISEGGLQLSMTRKIKLGTLLNMIINVVERNQDVPVLGKVVWVKSIPGYRGGYRVGVVFEEITPNDREIFREIVMMEEYDARKKLSKYKNAS